MTLLKQHLFRHQGHIGAYLVVAGVDPTGVHLFTVHAHGSTDKLPYVTMGSGSLAAMAIFETKWQKNLTREEAVALCAESIEAGIFNDLGSGSNVDVCVIVSDKVFYMFCSIYISISAGPPRPSRFIDGPHANTPEKATLMRNYITPNERVPKEQSYKFARGTTAFLKEMVIEKKDLKKFVTIVDLAASGGAAGGDVMEIDA